MEKNGRNERQLILLISDTILEFGSKTSMQGRPYFSVGKAKCRDWGGRKERKARGRGGSGMRTGPEAQIHPLSYVGETACGSLLPGFILIFANRGRRRALQAGAPGNSFLSCFCKFLWAFLMGQFCPPWYISSPLMLYAPEDADPLQKGSWAGDLWAQFLPCFFPLLVHTGLLTFAFATLRPHPLTPKANFVLF